MREIYHSAVCKTRIVVHQFVEIVDHENFRRGHIPFKHPVQTLKHARDLHFVGESVRLHRLFGAAAAHDSIASRVNESENKKTLGCQQNTLEQTRKPILITI